MKMQIRRTLGNEVCYRKQFPMNTVVLRSENGSEIFCSNFRKVKGNVTVYIHIPGEQKLYKMEMCNEYTEAMYKYLCQFKNTSKPLNYKQMMSHDRKRKCGSGGTRLRKWCGQVTDYECSKNPLHDFKRVYN